MSIGKFGIIAIVMIVLAGFFHIMFIMFDYGFNDPDAGAFRRVQESINNTLSGSYQNYVNNMTAKLRQFFGIGRVVVVGICIVCCALEILESRRPEEGGY